MVWHNQSLNKKVSIFALLYLDFLSFDCGHNRQPKIKSFCSLEWWEVWSDIQLVHTMSTIRSKIIVTSSWTILVFKFSIYIYLCLHDLFFQTFHPLIHSYVSWHLISIGISIESLPITPNRMNPFHFICWMQVLEPAFRYLQGELELFQIKWIFICSIQVQEPAFQYLKLVIESFHAISNFVFSLCASSTSTRFAPNRATPASFSLILARW